ncbi:MAG: glucosidase, partial [Kiritimatiellaceae bacterium]|nr:glucosidase [Kiritimatiellaceae bacterium]
MNAEQQRLENGSTEQSNWKKWGPYLSERQWGTVREDCGMDGNSWNHFTHDQARSRAYRWGEDGLGGISDDQQQLCFAVALWNGQDQILKERLFGLTNSEGNHGEDVKEYYFYIDSTPTHSYMKCLYKYPQKMFPYEDLLAANQARSRSEREYELLDTGIFAENRYFDVFVEYAKASPEDILVEVTVHNRGPEAARLEVLPTLWFRNDWTGASDAVRPVLKQADQSNTVELSHPILGQRFFYAQDAGDFLFTENESNLQRLYSTPNPTPYVKDGIHELIVMGNTGAVNPEKTGTKVAARYSLELAAGESRTLRLRLKDSLVKAPFSSTFKTTFASRRKEADEFYAQIIPASCNEDQVRVLRQALAGMLWSKQYYYYDVGRWLNEHGVNP